MHTDCLSVESHLDSLTQLSPAIEKEETILSPTDDYFSEDILHQNYSSQSTSTVSQAI